jgi:hypothetical protein
MWLQERLFHVLRVLGSALVLPYAGEAKLFITQDEGDIIMSAKKIYRKKQTPHGVNEESLVELPELDAEDQPLPSIASLSSEMDEDWDALSDWGSSPTPFTYALSDEIRPEYLPPDCPGWGRYDIDSIVCGLCRCNVDCMTAAEERTEPSRDQ